MRAQAFSLRSVRPKVLYGDAHRHTGVAAVAIGAVGKAPAPPEAQPDQLAVDLRIDQMAGRGYLRPGDPFRQVAARVRGRRIELQRREPAADPQAWRPGGLDAAQKKRLGKTLLAGSVRDPAGGEIRPRDPFWIVLRHTVSAALRDPPNHLHTDRNVTNALRRPTRPPAVGRRGSPSVHSPRLSW